MHAELPNSNPTYLMRDDGGTPFGRCLARCFGGSWFLIGWLVFYLFAILPIWEAWSTRSWEETPFTIVSSKVVTQGGVDGTSFSIAMTYDDDFDGIPHTGSSPEHEPGESGVSGQGRPRPRRTAESTECALARMSHPPVGFDDFWGGDANRGLGVRARVLGEGAAAVRSRWWAGGGHSGAARLSKSPSTSRFRPLTQLPTEPSSSQPRLPRHGERKTQVNPRSETSELKALIGETRKQLE